MAAEDVVFLFDVDDTLLDNDAVERDLKQHLKRAYGREACEGYWAILEQLRSDLSYVDYLGALERYRLEELHNPKLLRMSNWLVDYPFVERLYPGALAVLGHARKWGTPVVLSDGDAVFQPRKIERSGLWDAVGGDVLIYIHKEQELRQVERLYPARHYVLFDDKVKILDAVKKVWGDRVTTVFPRTGHYANDAKLVASYPAPDISIDSIGDLVDKNLSEILPQEAKA